MTDTRHVTLTEVRYVYVVGVDKERDDGLLEAGFTPVPECDVHIYHPLDCSCPACVEAKQ